MFLFLKKVKKTVEINFQKNNRFTIGRRKESDLVLNEKYISRDHCFLEFDQNNVYLYSQKQIKINGKKFSEKYQLNDKDIIQIGDIEIEFHLKKENSEKIEDWNVEKVLQWLKTENLEEVKDIFKENEINGLVLLTLSNEDFKDLNITKFGIRRRLEISIENLRENREKNKRKNENIIEEKNKKIKNDHQSNLSNDLLPSKSITILSDKKEENKVKLENQIIENYIQIDNNIDLNDPDYLLALKLHPKTCPICYDDFDFDLMIPLECQHEFCQICVSKYLTSKITEKSFPIQCPCCKKEISVSDIELNLDVKIVNLFHQFSLEYFIETNQKSYSCCPTPNCGYLFFFNQGDSTDFKCEKCKKRYCLKCKVDYHIGSTCEQYEQWAIENGLADELFSDFLSGSKFKKCPGCNRFVEKSFGCNHMTCRCKTEFCYLCGRLYPNECDTSCGRGDEDDEDEEDEIY